jgi:hypothetical protein
MPPGDRLWKYLLPIPENRASRIAHFVTVIPLVLDRARAYMGKFFFQAKKGSLKKPVRESSK